MFGNMCGGWTEVSKHLIPQSTIETVLQAHDIVDTVSKHVRLAKAGHRFLGLCPFHSEKTPSFNVSKERQSFYCFGCGEGGNAISFLMKLSGKDFVTVVTEMAEEAGIALAHSPGSQPLDEKALMRKRLSEAHRYAAGFFQHVLTNTQEGRSALEYLRRRGFSDELIAQFELGFAPLAPTQTQDVLVRLLRKHEYPLRELSETGLIRAVKSGNDYADRFIERIMIPIHNDKGAVIAFGGRILPQASTTLERTVAVAAQPDAKYVNSNDSPLFHKSQTIFNVHRALQDIRKTGTVVLCEGYFDVMKAWSAGIQNVVATMGTAITVQNLQFLRRFADKIIVCFDNDEAGQRAVSNQLEAMEKAGFFVKIALIPEGKDVDEFILLRGPQAFREQVMETAVSATHFRLQFLKRSFRLSDETEMLRYVREALALLAKLSSPTEREIHLKHLSEQFSLPLPELKQEFHDILNRMGARFRDDADFQSLAVADPARKPKKAEERAGQAAPQPAHIKAERMLLAMMLQDAEMTFYMMRELGDEFNVDEYGALAANLYVFYEEYPTASAAAFISRLDDDRLQAVAGDLSLIDLSASTSPQVINDYIREVRKYPLQKQWNDLREKLLATERAGDFDAIVEISQQMSTLQEQLKWFAKSETGGGV